MIKKIFNSDWFALILVTISGFLLGLLYFKGRTTEAVFGAILLAVAIVLIALGRGRSKRT
jgi:hypothetical protein